MSFFEMLASAQDMCSYAQFWFIDAVVLCIAIFSIFDFSYLKAFKFYSTFIINRSSFFCDRLNEWCRHSIKVVLKMFFIRGFLL